VLLVPVNVQLITPLLLGSFDTLAVNVWLPFIGTEIEDGLIEIAIEGGGLISLELPPPPQLAAVRVTGQKARVSVRCPPWVRP
jgi:hypothetical protein